MVRIYKRREFNLYSAEDGYIIHNSKGEFSQHHTHINNYHTAKYLIDLAIHKSIPCKHISSYLIESLIRISFDKNYIENLKRLKNSKSNKK